MNLKYVIIMPAHNEESYIGATLNTIINQSHRPEELIVVNDGSIDNTSEIVTKLSHNYPWIKLVNNSVKEKRTSGSKVIRAFYKGYNAITKDYAFITKLDADLTLPENYFHKISEMLEIHPKLGIVGGTIFTKKKGKWVYEHFSDKDHVKGAFKSYRKQCFLDIGGLKKSIGWDTADELLARYHGWDVQVNSQLEVRHHRPLGTETGSLKIRVQVGHGLYRMRYGLFISIVAALKAGYLNKPYIFTGIAVLFGFMQSWIRKDPFIVTKEEGKYFRKFRKKRMLFKLGLIKSHKL